MSATLGGALKQWLESQSLGIMVYSDRPPQRGNVSYPYAVFTGDLNLVLEPLEDSAASTGSEEVQLDLFQIWRDTTDKVIESATLADQITEALHGSQLGGGYGTPAKIIYCVIERARRRQVNQNERIVRHIYQLDVVRSV